MWLQNYIYLRPEKSLEISLKKSSNIAGNTVMYVQLSRKFSCFTGINNADGKRENVGFNG